MATINDLSNTPTGLDGTEEFIIWDSTGTFKVLLSVLALYISQYLASTINARYGPDNFPSASTIFDRGNVAYTGTQPQSTVTNLVSDLAAKALSTTLTSEIATVNATIAALNIDSIIGLRTELNTIRALIATPSPDAPVNSAIPAITGTLTVGSTLTSSTGTWSNSPTSYAYQWLRNGAFINLNSSSSTYVLVAADGDQKISVMVTASNANGPGVPKISLNSTIGAAATLPSFNGTVPTISAGTSPRTLYTVTQASGTTGTVTTRTFTWYVNDVQVGTGTTYQAVDANGSGALKVTETLTASGAVGSVSATSAIKTLDAAPAKPVNTVAPTASVNGLEVGNVLTVAPGTYTTNAGAVTLTYQYKRAGANIGSPTASNTYTFVSADVGQTISASEIATNTEGATTVNVAQTFVVSGQLPTNLGMGNRPVITATNGAVVGQTITVSTGTWDGNPSSYRYEWCRDSTSTVIGTNSNSYQLVSLDADKDIFCRVWGVNGLGESLTPASSLAYRCVTAATSASVIRHAQISSETVLNGDRGDGWGSQQNRHVVCANGDRYRVGMDSTSGSTPVLSGSDRICRLWKRADGTTTWTLVKTTHTNHDAHLLLHPYDDSVHLVIQPLESGVPRWRVYSSSDNFAVITGQTNGFTTQEAAYTGAGIGPTGILICTYQHDTINPVTAQVYREWVSATWNGTAWTFGSVLRSPLLQRHAYTHVLVGGHGDNTKWIGVDVRDVSQDVAGRPLDGDSGSYVWDGVRRSYVSNTSAGDWATSVVVAQVETPSTSDTSYTNHAVQDALVDASNRLHVIVRQVQAPDSQSATTSSVLYRVINSAGTVLHSQDLQAVDGIFGNPLLHLDHKGRVHILEMVASTFRVRLFRVDGTTFARTLVTGGTLTSGFNSVAFSDFPRNAKMRGGNRAGPYMEVSYMSSSRLLYEAIIRVPD